MSNTAIRQPSHTSFNDIGIIGYGNMGRAIATILHAKLPKKHKIYTLTKNRVTDHFVKPVPSYDVLCKKTDVVFFCIKPQDFHNATIATCPWSVCL